MGRRKAVVGVMALCGVLVVGVVGASASAQDATTSTTAPAGPAQCAEGVTFELLDSEDSHRVVVKATEANIRELPGLGCPILRLVANGKRLKTSGRRAQSDKAVWLEVKGKKFGTGWIYEGLVRDK